jgi:pimeloyl-ACP methyl ester carboxylesterase
VTDFAFKRATSADGTPIAYWCSGHGDPIVFVHGLSRSHVTWQAVAERLSDEFTACTVDRRGRGESGDVGSYSVQREAEDVVAVGEALGRAVVLAHSISGPFALEAARASDAIRAVILYEAWASPLSEVPPEMLDEVERLVALGRYEDAFAYGESPEDVERERQMPEYAERVATAPTFSREIRGWDEYWNEHPVEDDGWRALEKPVLLLAGERNRDGMGPPAELFAQRLPQASVRVLDGQGHNAEREAPDLVAAVLRSWVASLP